MCYFQCHWRGTSLAQSVYSNVSDQLLWSVVMSYCLTAVFNCSVPNTEKQSSWLWTPKQFKPLPGLTSELRHLHQMLATQFPVETGSNKSPFPSPSPVSQAENSQRNMSHAQTHKYCKVCCIFLYICLPYLHQHTNILLGYLLLHLPFFTEHIHHTKCDSPVTNGT